MNDVTAIILSVGEDFTDRAIESVQRQTLLPVETAVVRGVFPFHHAFNTGAERVRTEYFIQVDADMILDPTCIEDLRSCMADEVGFVVGHLRDPLLGRIFGVKLFRTSCLGNRRLPDSVSPETDFANDMMRAGWRRIYALKYTGNIPAAWHVFGEHRPDYNPHYTFSKYAREGSKARHRKAGGALRSVFGRFYASTHDMAKVATIAAAHGIFAKDERDPHEPFAGNEESRFLEEFLHTRAISEDLPEDFQRLTQSDFKQGFKLAYALGSRLRRAGNGSVLLGCMEKLEKETDVESWVALVGMCHGLFSDEYVEAQVDEAFAVLGELLPGTPPRNPARNNERFEELMMSTPNVTSDPAASTAPSAAHRVEILPYKGWEHPNFAELWEFRFLLLTMVLRNVHQRYRQTLLGPLWFVLGPLLRMVQFSVLLGFVARLSSEGVPYPVYIYPALLPWELFRSSARESMLSLTNYIRVISKAHFPRLILPVCATLTAGIDFLISFVILLVLALLYGYPPTLRLLVLIPLVALAMILGLSVGMLLSALQVRYRDTDNIFEYVLQIWFYATPVAYSSTVLMDRVPTWTHLLYRLNPMNGVVEGFRWAVIGTGRAPDWILAVTGFLTCVLLYCGAIVFKKTEHSIIDLI